MTLKYILPRSTAIALFCVSTTYSVLLWMTISTSQLEQYLAIVTAVSLQVCQFYFLPVGIERLKSKKKWASGVIFSMIGLCLLVISIGASIGFLERSGSDTNLKSVMNSTEYMTYSKRIDSLTDQISILRNSAKRDLNGIYRKRGLTTLKEIQPLDATLSELIAARASLSPVKKSTTSALFDSAALLFNEPVEKVRGVIHLLLAVVIDVCCIGCIVLGWPRLERDVDSLTSQVTNSPVDSTSSPLIAEPQPLSVVPKNPAVEVNDGALLVPCIVQADSLELVIQRVITHAEEKDFFSIELGKRERMFNVLNNLLIEDEFGSQPQITQVRNILQVSANTAKRVFDALVDEGKLVREGQRYRLSA